MILLGLSSTSNYIDVRLSYTGQTYLCMSSHEIKTITRRSRAGFSSPLSINYIVWAYYTRTQHYSWVVKNRVPTIGAVYGKVCALAQMAVESSLYQAAVREVPSISSNVQLLLQHKLPLGATPCSANGTNTSRGFQSRDNSPQLLKKKIQVLDRTKALYGSRTQACGETTT